MGDKMKKLIKKINHGCSLDCFDLCQLEILRKKNKVMKIVGSQENKFTKAIICAKGRKHIKRLYHKDRLKKPLLKINGEFKEISFNEALNILSKKLLEYKEKYGSTSVLHYEESGAGGFLKGIENTFFNFYGGITTSEGSTCWGAGKAAQKYDFGEGRTSDIDDIFNSKCVILWGRNPYNTSIHLYERLQRAKKQGIKIVVIDPRYNESMTLADTYISPNPSTDGLLAMGILKRIIDREVIDLEYIDKNIIGYREYNDYLKGLEIDYIVEETGVALELIDVLADILIEGNVSCFLGYGLQKYTNGGNSIRAIDALMSISKNIGVSGAGVFYSNKVYTDILNRDPYNSEKSVTASRTFKVNEFIPFIEESVKDSNKPIKMIMVSKSNPLNQYPNLNNSIETFNKIEFKVCIDMFLTDTAKYCDLVLPASSSLESEDIIYSSMHSPYLFYNEIVVEPEDQLMDEYYFFRELAMKMELKEYPNVDKVEYLNEVLKPIGETIDTLKKKQVNLSKDEVAWRDMKFKTPSKKVEVYSEKAKSDGYSPIPTYTPSLKATEKYPLRFITPHAKNSLFSQHFQERDDVSKLYVGKKIFEGLKEGEIVKLSSKYGSIECRVSLNEGLREDMVYMYAGWNHKHGNPNFLTYNGSSEMGGQVTYYDTFVRVDKIK